jgi:hypothetical protein
MLPAESACENVFSIMGNVVNSGNSRLGDKYVDKLTTLRANRRFMQFMRDNYHAQVFDVKKSDPVFVQDEDSD